MDGRRCRSILNERSLQKTTTSRNMILTHQLLIDTHTHTHTDRHTHTHTHTDTHTLHTRTNALCFINGSGRQAASSCVYDVLLFQAHREPEPFCCHSST